MERNDLIQKILEMIKYNQPASTVLAAMVENKVTPEEVLEAMTQLPKSNEHFDLLCEVEGELKRVPFAKGKELNPKAIFICDDLPYYLDLEETGMQSFPDLKDKDRLMDEKLCYLIRPVRHELNEKLSDLGKAPLRGEYWLNGHEYSGTGYWTAIFREGRLDFGTRDITYHDPKHTAKVRFIGHF